MELSNQTNKNGDCSEHLQYLQARSATFEGEKPCRVLGVERESWWVYGDTGEQVTCVKRVFFQEMTIRIHHQQRATLTLCLSGIGIYLVVRLLRASGGKNVEF